MRKEYWAYIENVISPQDDENTYQPMKRFWKYVKHKKNDNTGISDIKENGKLITEDKAKADLLNQQFQSVFIHETPMTHTFPLSEHPVLPDINITEEGVYKLLNNLHPAKASGPDNISPQILKELAAEISPILCGIFKKSLESGVVPNDWKNANIVPVFKKGQRNDKRNYRPISLTCIASKVMEHIICSNIMNHAEVNSILHPNQHGFRTGRSCETQLIDFIHEVASNMKNGLQTDVCILDFAKAFDKVGHQRLLSKLQWYGIRGNVLKWIQSFLTDRKQRVVINGASSSSISVLSGVPQGSVVGPCLFLFYINDISNKIKSTIRLFADDTMIYTTITGNAGTHCLQTDLYQLEDWSNAWQMQFHPEKSEIISITRKKEQTQHNYTLCGSEIICVDVAKYLGINIHKHLKWNSHVDIVTSKADAVLNFLRRNLDIRNQQLKSLAYKSCVRPLLEYAHTVWDPYTSNLITKLEMVQRRAARFACNNYNRTASVTSMMKDLEWETLEERRRTARLVMFHKIHYNKVAIEMKLNIKNNRRASRRENRQSYHIPPSPVNYFKCSFYPRTAAEWNHLPDHTVNVTSTAAFKTLISIEQ